MSATSVLDRLLIYFAADTVALKHGAKEAKQVTDKVSTSISHADVLSHKLGHSFKETIASIGGGLAAFLSLDAIAEGVLKTAEYADQLGKLSQSLNLNIEDLSAWSDAVKLCGGSAEEFQETAKRMSAQLADFATKGVSRAAPFFKELGISMVDAQGHARSFMALLPEIADKFQHLSRSESFGMGERMGLDRGTILLLQQGRGAVEAMIEKQKALGAVTQEQAETAEKFEAAWMDVTHAFRTLALDLGELLLPVLTAVSNAFARFGEFASKHAHFVAGALMVLGGAITAFVLPPLISMAIAAAIAFAPFFAIGAIIAAVAVAFGLLYDDIQNFIEGNNSLIGQFLGKYPLIKAVIMGIVDYVRFLWAVWSSTMTGIANLILHPIDSFYRFKEVVKEGVDWVLQHFPRVNAAISNMGAAFSAVGQVVKSVWDAIFKVISGTVEEIGKAVAAVGRGYDKVKAAFGGKTQPSVASAQGALTQASGLPITQIPGSALSAANSSSVKNTNVTVSNVNVNTQATDADGIAKHVGGALSDQMRHAVNIVDDGVAA